MINKTVCFYDNGLFIALVMSMVGKFKRILYYYPTEGPFPKSSIASIGSGIEGIERIKDNEFWKRLPEIDIFVFTDVYDSDLQNYLRSIGKAVVGMFDAEFLEVDRWEARDWQYKVGLPTPKTLLITGIDSLRSYLQENDDLYVKLSYFRGDGETYHHKKYSSSQYELLEIEKTLGANKDNVEFMVEEPTAPDGVECGYDGFTVDGRFPNYGMYGYEIKDQAYLGKVVPYTEMPQQLRFVNDKLSTVFRKYKSRGFFSTEVRVDQKNIPYLIDPCMRCGSPPTEVNMECYSNIPEFLVAASQGTLLMLKPKAKYAAQAMIYSGSAKVDWMEIGIPKESLEYVKIKNLTIRNGGYFSVPCGLETIGAVVGTGDTIDEAIDCVKRHADDIEADDFEVKVSALDEAIETVKKGESFGIPF